MTLGSHGLLDLFISPDLGICSTVDFPPLGNSYDPVPVSTDFPSNSKGSALYHCSPFTNSHKDGDGLYNHLRYVPWVDIFKLGASVAAVKFYQQLQVGIEVCIAHCEYQVKPHSSP